MEFELLVHSPDLRSNGARKDIRGVSEIKRISFLIFQLSIINKGRNFGIELLRISSLHRHRSRIKIKLIIRTMFSLEVIQFSGNNMYFPFFFIFRFLIYNFNRKNNCLIKSKFYEIWFVVNMRL